MKLWKSSMLFVGVAILLLSSITVSAETESDTQGDVWHFVYPYWQSQTVGNQPNVDIKEIKAEISGDQITLSMTLWPGGTFSRSQYSYVMYIMFYNTSDAYYMMSYSDVVGEDPLGSAFGMSLDGSYPIPSSAEVTVNGNTISATMDKVGDDTTTTELYGLAWMYEEYFGEELTHDQWHDYVGDYTWDPDTGSGNGDNDDDTTPSDDDDDTTTGDDDDDDGGGGTDGGTPGFEAIAVIAAIAIALIILRRRK